MIFQQLENFIAVAECGSINHAAERLFISQQSLRASINSLENKLGFKLFYRSVHGMTLTEAGYFVLNDAKKIVAISEKWQQFSRPDIEVPETVEVVASTLVYNTVMTDVIKSCRQLYPKLGVSLYHTRNDSILSHPKDNAIGIAASGPERRMLELFIPASKENGMDACIFANDSFVIFMNSAHPLAQRPFLLTKHLKALTLAAYPGEDKNFFYRDVYQYFAPNPPFFIQHQENIFQLIAEMNDVGAVFPRLATYKNRYYENGAIVAKPVKDYPMPSVSCMVYPSKDKITPGQKILTTMIRERLENIYRELDELIPL
ncbi:MAG: LysR family transcriptional regulator [Peptococcaceae bacterium]|nr:LysR family transcriptional regulator [Peptococcaceae bacterium]